MAWNAAFIRVLVFITISNGYSVIWSTADCKADIIVYQ